MVYGLGVKDREARVFVRILRTLIGSSLGFVGFIGSFLGVLNMGDLVDA